MNFLLFPIILWIRYGLLFVGIACLVIGGYAVLSRKTWGKVAVIAGACAIFIYAGGIAIDLFNYNRGTLSQAKQLDFQLYYTAEKLDGERLSQISIGKSTTTGSTLQMEYGDYNIIVQEYAPTAYRNPPTWCGTQHWTGKPGDISGGSQLVKNNPNCSLLFTTDKGIAVYPVLSNSFVARVGDTVIEITDYRFVGGSRDSQLSEDSIGRFLDSLKPVKPENIYYRRHIPFSRSGGL